LIYKPLLDLFVYALVLFLQLIFYFSYVFVLVIKKLLLD